MLLLILGPISFDLHFYEIYKLSAYINSALSYMCHQCSIDSAGHITCSFFLDRYFNSNRKMILLELPNYQKRLPIVPGVRAYALEGHIRAH